MVLTSLEIEFNGYLEFQSTKKCDWYWKTSAILPGRPLDKKEQASKENT